MYPKFIELHLAKDDCLVSLNIGKIVAISDYDNNGEGYLVKTSDRGDWLVRDTYDEMKQMITDCGCLIKKADPRLDMERPLTMDDLSHMVGEPVWNSNLNVWLLVKECSDIYVDLLWTSGNTSTWDEEELKSFPLYRIRR